MLHAFERYLGATDAGEPEFVRLQASAMADFGFDVSQEMRISARLLRDYAVTLSADTALVDPVVADQSALDVVVAIQERIRQSGFLSEELDELAAEGYTADEVAQIRALFDLDFSDVPVGVSIEMFLEDAADDFDAAAIDYDAIAREASSVASLANTPPDASFIVDPSSGTAPLDVTFTDTSTDSDGDSLTASWEFGDGATASGSPVDHQYASGTYTATLTVSDGAQSDTASTTIVVTPDDNLPPTAAFTQDKTAGSAPLEVAFTNQSTDPNDDPLSYAWDFGDGATSALTSPTHSFADPGDYEVTLVVTDPPGASSQSSVIISASGNRPPEPSDDSVTADPAVALDVLGNDGDPDQDPLTLVDYTQPAHGTAECGPLGGCLYVADAGYSGEDSFDYTVIDSNGLEGSATVLIVVTEPPPITSLNLQSDSLVTLAGQAATIDVLANDDPASLTVGEVSDASHGAVTCDPDGQCTYTPDAGYVGYDGFRYTATDGSAQAAADVLVLVAPATAAIHPTVGGIPTGVTQGDDIDWIVGVEPSPVGLEQSAAMLFATTLEVDLEGAHALAPGSMTTARGWTATDDANGIHVIPGPDALIGESVSSALPRPAQPISQGTGGDGHVPIVVGNRVYAFFHHSWPTSITCIDRTTGQLCPGYPHQLNVGASPIVGPAAVVGSKIYIHADVSFGRRSALALYCWDTALNQTCGLVVVDRLDEPLFSGYAAASAPVNVDGQVYFVGQTGLLYCVDPTSNAPCATTPIDTGLGDGPTPPQTLDIVAHGDRVFSFDPDAGDASCVDVVAHATCTGWTSPRPIEIGYNLVNRYSAAGLATGVCFVTYTDSRCIEDATPATISSFGGWPQSSTYYNITAEAEAGSRTFYGSGLGTGGLGCWDWESMAVCAGDNFLPADHSFAAGFATLDINGSPLPIAYGAAWDGSCAIGLGDPGLMFTMATDGSSPCTTLSTSADRRSIDLRDQRCDETVGEASWLDARVVETDLDAGIEFTSFRVTIRDGLTGQVLATQEMIGTSGVLDLSAVDSTAHPSISVDASATSVPGGPAWSDDNPPRVELRWSGDPAQVCFQTTTVVDCTAPATSDAMTIAALGDETAGATVQVTKSPTCGGTVNHPPTLEAIPNQTIPEMGLFNLTLVATDSDGDTPLEYSVSSGPTALTVNPTTGVLAWTPTEAQGPGLYPVTVGVTDPGGLLAERSFSITVTEVNRDPVLAALADQTVYPGDLVSLTASATDPDLPANSLTYSLAYGPAGATVDATSGSFAWTASATPGDYSVAIGVSDGAGGSDQRSFTIHVVRDTTSLTLGGDTAGQYSDRATITATLKVGTIPVVGTTVSISLGATSMDATTNASGVASVTVVIPGPSGTLPISASFAGTPSRAPSSASGTFTVNREDSILVYSGDTIGLAGATLRLSATFTDSAAAAYTGINSETGANATIGDITNARVAFAIYAAATCLSGSPLTTLFAFVTDTGAAGDGIGTATVTWSSSSEGTFCIVPSLVGAAGTGLNGYYTAPPADAAGLAVFIDTAGKVTGGGWVAVGDGRANFGFNATSNRGKVKGNLVFIERTTYQGERAMLIIRSNAIATLRTSGSTFPITTTLTGKATFKVISSVDGSTLVESGNATFTATVVDTNARSASGDTFAIRVLDKTGAVLVDLETTPLGGGNIVAHLK